MVALPGTSFYWRVDGGEDDATALAATDWTLDADGDIDPSDGQDIMAVCVGVSAIARNVNDTTPSITGIADQTGFAYGDAPDTLDVSGNATGTNLVYSLESLNGQITWAEINQSGVITFTHPTSGGAVDDDIVVTISNAAGSNSDSFNVTYASVIPEVPSAINDLAATAGNEEVILTWTAPAENNSPITDYVVEFKLSASSTWTVFNDGVSATPGATVTGLTNDSLYDFRVAAVNGVGQGPYSNVVNETPADVQVEPLSVDAEGWRLEIDTPDASYDPDTSPVEFNITTQGHDALGNSVTYSESIALTNRIRNPLQVDPGATLDSNDVSASKRIYSSDTLPGSMTNNSTAAYPFCGFVWTVPNHQVLNIDDDMELGIYVSHMHARNGKPVAAVEFIIEDESGNTLSSGKITTLTDKTYTASSLHAPIYEHTFTAADLSGSSLEKPTTVAAENTDAPTCSVRAIFYPWRGTSHSTDDIMQGGEGIEENTSLTFLNNLGNYRPKSYAYVDATLGNDGTGVVSTDPATAQASPYATSGAAQTDIRNFYDARTQTRGYLENGHIRFEEGTHVLTTTSRTAAFRGHLIMEAADPANKATTIITDNGSSSVEMATALWMRNLTIRRSTATSAPATFLTGDTSSTLLTEFVGTNLTCDDNGNGAGIFFGGVSTAFSSKFIKDCDHTSAAPMIAGNKMIGCDLPNSSSSTVGRVACNIRGYNINPNTTARVQGNITGHCYMSYGKDAGNSSMLGIDEDIGVKGFHVVGSVLEMYPNGGSSGAGFRINADGTQRTADNVVVQGITFPRYRANFLYLDNGTTNYQQRGVSQGCIWLEMNQKSDFYSAQDQSSANRTGNWKNRYGVDWAKNMIIQGDSQGGTPTSDNYQGSWLGEDSGLGANTGTQENPLSITWTDDQTGASGGGDYTPSGSTTDIPKWGTDDAPYNVDLYGNALGAGTTVGAVAV